MVKDKVIKRRKTIVLGIILLLFFGGVFLLNIPKKMTIHGNYIANSNCGTMQSYIRPYEVESVISKLELDEDHPDLMNIKRIYRYADFDYTSDEIKFGSDDYWQTPAEFMRGRKGDCEDWSIYTLSLMRAYNPNIPCYAAIWDGHMNVLCVIKDKFIIFDQEGFTSTFIFNKELSIKEDTIDITFWKNQFFRDFGYGGIGDLYYLFNDKECIEFDVEDKEDFANWVIDRGFEFYNLSSNSSQEEINYSFSYNSSEETNTLQNYSTLPGPLESNFSDKIIISEISEKRNGRNTEYTLLFENPTENSVIYYVVAQPKEEGESSISQATVVVEPGLNKTVTLTVNPNLKEKYDFYAKVFLNGNLIQIVPINLPEVEKNVKTPSFLIIILEILAVFVVVLFIIRYFRKKKNKKSKH